MKSLMGMSHGGNSELLGLANMHTDGDIGALSNTINNFLVSVSSDLPRLTETRHICQHTDPLPAAFTISVKETEDALNKVKVNKATGPDNIPPWILRDFSHILAAPLVAIYNSCLREGVLPSLWETATIVPLPKKHPPLSVENDIRPISLTPIACKVFESIVLKWVDSVVRARTDCRQFGSISGTCTIDILVEMVHQWYQATDTQGAYVRILLLDFSKAFDLINHTILIDKLQTMGLRLILLHGWGPSC